MWQAQMATQAAASGNALIAEAEYDRNEIEERLVGNIEACVVEWTTQDLGAPSAVLSG